MSTMKESISSLWIYGCSLFTLLTLHCVVFHLFLNHRCYLQNIFLLQLFLIEQDIVFNSFILVWFVVV